MGLWLHTEDCEAEIHIGYCSFAFYRMWIADCLNAEGGAIYKKIYFEPQRKYTENQLARMNEIFPNGARVFLYHCDCDGELSAEECAAIVHELGQIELKRMDNMPPDAFESHKKTWESMLEVFKYAATNRVKLCFD